MNKVGYIVLALLYISLGIFYGINGGSDFPGRLDNWFLIASIINCFNALS